VGDSTRLELEGCPQKRKSVVPLLLAECKKNLTHLPNIFLEENIWKKAMFINIPLVFNIPFIFH
jgi:hypothetical protein